MLDCRLRGYLVRHYCVPCALYDTFTLLIISRVKSVERAEVGGAGRALRWLAAAQARTKGWRWWRRGRGATAGSVGGALRGRGQPAERSRRGGAAFYGRGGSFRPRRERRRREGLAGLGSKEDPYCR